MMRATVEEAHCVGCGMCVDVCPQIFSFTEQHRAQGGYVSPRISTTSWMLPSIVPSPPSQYSRNKLRRCPAV